MTTPVPRPATSPTTEPTVLADGFRFLECPRWREDRLYVSDMHSGRVVTVDLDGHVETVVEVPGRPTGLGWLPDGTLLVASNTERRVYRLGADASLELYADLSRIGRHEHPINDMWVSPEGRAYVGEYGVEVHSWMREHLPTVAEKGLSVIPELPIPTGAVFRIDPDGTVDVAVPKMRFPNGMTSTRDSSGGNRLVAAETFGLRLATFALDPATGAATDRRHWELDFAPDGVSEPDAEGCIWVASPLEQAVHRIAPGGKRRETIHASRGVYACAFGGPDQRTLFLCTATTAEPDDTEQLRDSRLETIRVEVPRG